MGSIRSFLQFRIQPWSLLRLMLLVFLLVAGGVTVLVLPSMLKLVEHERTTQCANNLSNLWRMQNIYNTQFTGGQRKLMIQSTGKDFWLDLSRIPPPLLDETSEYYVCPSSGTKATKGVCTYWGPAQDVNTMAESDPVGMCDDPHHGDEVIIFRKSGDVMQCTRDDPPYKRALQVLKK